MPLPFCWCLIRFLRLCANAWRFFRLPTSFALSFSVSKPACLPASQHGRLVSSVNKWSHDFVAHTMRPACTLRRHLRSTCAGTLATSAHLAFTILSMTADGAFHGIFSRLAVYRKFYFILISLQFVIFSMFLILHTHSPPSPWIVYLFLFVHYWSRRFLFVAGLFCLQQKILYWNARLEFVTWHSFAAKAKKK